MSSIHKQAGRPCYFCAFTNPDGFRKFKSTRTEIKSAAKVICEAWEHGSALAKAGKLSNERALKLIRDAVRTIEEKAGPLAARRGEQAMKPIINDFVRLAGGSLEDFTVKSWLEHWLAGRTNASPATILEYRRSVDLFNQFLGAKADRPLSSVSNPMIEDYKGSLATRLAPSSVNKQLKIMRCAFKAAVVARQIEFNPAEHVAGVSTKRDQKRDPFTNDEVRLLLKHSKGDVKTWVAIAAYTGLRSGDAANLSWADVDLEAGRLTVDTKKTGFRVVNPIPPALRHHLEKLPNTGQPDAEVTPSLAGKRSGYLANQFHDVMVAAGLAEKRTHQSRGIGREAKRKGAKKSFHSLRYFFVTGIKALGAPQDLAKDLAGHENEEISRHYTRFDDATKMAAVARLPDLLNE